MMTLDEKRSVMLNVVVILENYKVKEYYLSMTEAYCEITIHADTILEMARYNKILNQVPFELKKEFTYLTIKGLKLYTCHIQIKGVKAL